MNAKLMIALLMTCVAVFAVSDSTLAQDNYEEAYKLATAGKHAEAIPLLEEHCNKYPKDPKGGNLLAQCYIKTKQVEKASERLAVVLEHHPEDDKSQFLMGTVLQLQKKTEKALTHFELAAKAKPENGTYQYYYGSVLLQMKKLPEAGEALEKAVKAMPNDPKANLDYGRLFVLTGDYESAASHLQIAAKSDSTKALALPYLGIAQLQTQKYDDAIVTLTQATAADKTDPKLFFNLGQAYDAKIGDKPQSPDAMKNSIEAYSEAVKLDAQNADAQYKLGRAYEKAALTIYEKAHEETATDLKAKAIDLLGKAKTAYGAAVKIDAQNPASKSIAGIDEMLASLNQ